MANSVRNRISEVEGLSNMRDSLVKLNLELLNCKWINTKSKYPINCPIHGQYMASYYVILNGHGCGKCGTITTHNKQKLTDEEVKIQLLSMGFTIGSNFKYLDGYTPIEGAFLNGKEYRRRLYSFRDKFKLIGHPVGFACGSIDDSWIGFICSLVSPSSEYLCKPDFLNGRELDVYDHINNMAFEFDGPYHDELSSKTKLSSDVKIKICKEMKIDLIVINWKDWPKNRTKQTELILNHYKNKGGLDIINKIIHSVDERQLDPQYHLWCKEKGLFDRIKFYQEKVKQELLTKGLPKGSWPSPAHSRLGQVVWPSSKYFSQEILELSIKMGYKPNTKNYVNLSNARIQIQELFLDRNKLGLNPLDKELYAP